MQHSEWRRRLSVSWRSGSCTRASLSGRRSASAGRHLTHEHGQRHEQLVGRDRRGVEVHTSSGVVSVARVAQVVVVRVGVVGVVGVVRTIVSRDGAPVVVLHLAQLKHLTPVRPHVAHQSVVVAVT